MKYYRFNQIAMAVLGALLLFFGARTLVNIAYEEPEREKPGFEVSGTEEKPGGGKTKPAGPQLATLLASADAAHGADIAKKCSVCHNFEKGGPNMIGPDLYGVLGRKIASHEGYEYSDALKAKGSETWDYEKIDHMIENPNAFAPGTKMALFPGLPDAKQRADVLVFLRTKNDNPPPLPEAKPEAAPAGEAKPGGEAGGGAAPAGGSEVVALIATADPKQGQTDAGLCKVCHKFEKGGGALVGPDLYGVVGRKIASVEGFNYTPALKAHAGDVWTYEKLDPWLKNPQEFAPGTMMAFPGVPDAKKRANIIAFLRMNADTPAPLPEAAGGGAAGEMPAPAGAPAAAPEAAAPSVKTPSPPADAVPLAAPEEAAPSAETPAPPAGTPQAAPEEAPPAEATPPSAGEEPAPSAETPAAETAPPVTSEEPSAEEPAPSAETPQAAPAETPEAEMPSAAPETAPAAEQAQPGDAASSSGEGPFANQPQPVYPEGSPEAAR
jgi:cytochrome c2